ncbi:LysM peptidoglycan-binding domain-containing protein [bacterium]|nr:LysM peptidoglycan-binding domain-containing protein [bacterium]
MNSTTIDRSNISEEKMAVLDALKRYKNGEFSSAPSVYIRQETPKGTKHEELDLLWNNFKMQDMITADKAPKMFVAAGIVAGVILMVSLVVTGIFAHGVSKDTVAKSEYTLISSSGSSGVVENNEHYVVQSGDTIEKILIRFYGSYTKTFENNLLKANNLSNPNKLSIGQELVIPMNNI